MSWYLATVASLALVYFVTQPWLGNKVGNAGFDTPFVGIRYSWLVPFQFFLSTDSIPEHGYRKYKGRPWKLTGNDVPSSLNHLPTFLVLFPLVTYLRTFKAPLS
ncbi:hypothetical protein BDV33DRAFT_100890 [Aspergillus novoparasiticus]|uniref:Ergosterol biosynthesis ERG4/ERG24 n=1 Tax=Aspergillus novoparasiticus TaxID=986946 RepID=A0A5N6ER56_9EURO|nr:hypothetical protein BDV33DRAFT_100890 [Aspergillus novoparasiticus]